MVGELVLYMDSYESVMSYATKDPDGDYFVVLMLNTSSTGKWKKIKLNCFQLRQLFFLRIYISAELVYNSSAAFSTDSDYHQEGPSLIASSHLLHKGTIFLSLQCV